MKRESFIVYKSFYGLIKLLKAPQRLAMYEAIFNYGFTGEMPEFSDDTSEAIWEAVLPQLKANQKRYENGLRGGAPVGNSNARKNNQETIDNAEEKQPKNNQKQPNENENENENVNVNENDKKKAPTGLKKKQAFSPPSLTEVKSYCSERGNNIDPQGFIDFYEAKGWMIGKNKMKDWKAAVRTWERKEREDSGGRTTDGSVKQNQTPWDELLHTEYI